MFERYHIETKPAPLLSPVVSKFKIIRQENCINCGCCLRSCIYDVHQRLTADPRRMADPEHHLCKNFFRCIQECPAQALTKIINPDYRTLGNNYWRNELISRIWFEAETGRIPVLGAGYRGKFGGAGFDGMWTDLSEIVRPTRDGIHGREYINTAVDLGKKLPRLSFNAEQTLDVTLPPIVEIPLPVIFNPVPLPESFQPLQESFIRAASKLKTFAMTPISFLAATQNYNAVIPRLTSETAEIFLSECNRSNRLPLIVELDYEPKNTAALWSRLKKTWPNLIISVRLPFQPGVEKTVVALTQQGAEVIHLYADQEGKELNTSQPRFLKELVRSVHLSLVEKSIRDEVTLIVSGGIAAAEHIPKIIICGADLVGLDFSLAVALGCRMCVKCSWTDCPARLNKITTDWATQRLLNLMGAWRDQLLEIMSAMGLREVRRLRGETGRAIFQEEMEKEIFSDKFSG